MEKLQEKDKKLEERLRELTEKIDRQAEICGEKIRLKFDDLNRKRSIKKTLEENEKASILVKHTLL